MTVVSDSSPLITLARIGCLDHLAKLYGTVYVSSEVYREVSIDGAGRPGANQVARAVWIEVMPVRDIANFAASAADTGLGAGELSAIVLAKELAADLVLMDERRARRFAQTQGLTVTGCVGILEDLYQQGDLSDLRGAYQELIRHKMRIDLQTLRYSLAKFKLPDL